MSLQADGGLRDRLKRVEGVVSQLPERFENLKQRLEQMHQRIGKLEARIRRKG